MIVIGVSAFVLRTVLKQIIKSNIAQNESNVYATLKLISAALENYQKDNKGLYPTSLSALTKTSPPYLEKDYDSQSSLKGYTFSCLRLEPSGYSCMAVPLICNFTGKLSYTAASGGTLASEECNKKD